MFLYLIQSLSLSDRPHSKTMSGVVVNAVSATFARIQYLVQCAMRKWGIPMVYDRNVDACLPRDPPVLMRT